MRVVFVAPEMDPLVKVGGLADVVAALSLELHRRGDLVSVILPFYAAIGRGAHEIVPTGLKIRVPLGGALREAALWQCHRHGVRVYLIEKPELFDRKGVYGSGGTDYDDNAHRFAYLARAALEAVKALELEPTVFHIHDWQTGLLPLYKKLHYQHEPAIARAGVVLTIHNLAYQGLFPADDLPRLGLPLDVFHIGGVEFHGKLSFLKAGLVYSDLLTTVSPTYAREIQTPEDGAGLDGLLRHRACDLVGILNGIDPSVWDPSRDRGICQTYSARDLDGKRTNKQRLQASLGLQVSSTTPLFGCIARLDPQKGLDLIVEAAPQMIAAGAQLVLLGSGRREVLEAFLRLAEQHPRRLSINEGFQPELAPKIYAGADMFLMPSRYEPCGLGQMIALRYGTIPVVRRTGGLADTVIDVDEDPEHGNGFVFTELTASALVDAMQRGVRRFKHRAAWQNLVRRAMKQDFSWKSSVERYREVYVRAAEKPAKIRDP